MEQLNIEGKRSGEGFVAHLVALIVALSRALAARVEVAGVVVGRKGFLAYLKALGGSNIVKVVPDSGDGASESQPVGKGLKVVCGANTGHLVDGAWTTEKMAFADICDLRVSPNVSVVPNMGALELSEALARVIPFAAKGKDAEDKPVLGTVRFGAADGKLTLTAADGICLATLALDYGDGEGGALIPADEVKGLVSALRKARRVRVSFDDVRGLVVETECISYRFSGVSGTYPDYESLFPTEFVAEARFDAREAMKAVASLSALSVDKGVGVVLAVKDGTVSLSVLDDQGTTTIEAEASGEMVTALNSRYLSDTLKALGGMAEVKLTGDTSAPVLFCADGYRAMVMPVALPAKPQAEGEAQAQAETPTEGQDTTVCPECGGRKSKTARMCRNCYKKAKAQSEPPAEAETPTEAREPVGATA